MAHSPTVRGAALLVGTLGGVVAGALPRKLHQKALAGMTTTALGYAPTYVAERAAARRSSGLLERAGATPDELRANDKLQRAANNTYHFQAGATLAFPLLGAAYGSAMRHIIKSAAYNRTPDMPDYVTSILTKLSAVHETRRKMRVRGFYNDPSPGMYDLKGKFEDAARSNATHERKVAFDVGAQPPEQATAPAGPVQPTYEIPGATPLHNRFNRYLKILDQKGAFAGTGHRRVVIPKSKITEEDIGTLGFEPVVAAIPEAGQDRFQSWRHPDNNYHIHSHGDRWTIHQDRHPAMTMLARKVGPVEAFTQGVPHVITEGIPGLGYYLIGRMRGNDSTANRVDQELPPEVKEELAKVAADTLERYGFHGVKHAAEQSNDPVSALVDVFRKTDFGFDENGQSKGKTKFKAKGAVGSGSEIEATTPMPLGGFW